MAMDEKGETIMWTNAGRRPQIWIFHISIVIPLVSMVFLGWIPLVIWAACDLALQRYQMSLVAAVARMRLWGRGGIRKSITRREYFKNRRRIN